jgi:iron complex transport system substrate-binding protein
MTAIKRLLPLAAITAVMLSAAAVRIVSLSPSTTEILYGVGAFPRVVGVSQYCSYPPEAAKLPRIGGWQTTSIEKIVALHPDLVIVTEPQVPFIADGLNTFHLRWVAVPAESLRDVFTAIQRIGEATGNVQEASALEQQTRLRLNAVRNEAARLPKRSVLLNVSRTPGTLSDLYVATEGSYLIDLLELAGGRSVVTPTKMGYGKISKETVMALNPEVIIDLMNNSGATFAEDSVRVWNDLPEVQAVRSKHVYMVDDPFVVHPSQFVAHTAETFLRLLHPELGAAASR